MRVRGSWMMGVGCTLLLLAPIGAVAAEGDHLLATMDKPAVVTATASSAPTSLGQPAGRQVVISVTGYQPPQGGAIQGVVKAQRPDGSEQQIGTIGVFPDTAFKADSSRPRTYNFPLPKELQGASVKLKVELVPLRGKAEGAQLEVGSAEIR